MSKTVLKKLWTDNLHTHTTQILASLPDDSDLERVSEIAYKIHDNNQDQNVYAIQLNKWRNTKEYTNANKHITNNYARQVNWAAAGHGKSNSAGSKFGEVPSTRTFPPLQNLLMTQKSK